MAITVRFFAALRERLGVESLALTGGDTDLNGVLDLIRQRLGDAAVLALRSDDVRVALNREFVSGECRVHDGDEVAFMPPITGG